jgi:hypothetical protein
MTREHAAEDAHRLAADIARLNAIERQILALHTS